MVHNPLLRVIEYLDAWGDHSYSIYKCTPCDRDFSSERALYDHCANASVHHEQWCGRCQRLFISNTARESHKRNSQFHNLCQHCDLDFPGTDSLTEHMEEAHHYCSPCERFFENNNNLIQVGEGLRSTFIFPSEWSLLSMSLDRMTARLYIVKHDTDRTANLAPTDSCSSHP